MELNDFKERFIVLFKLIKEKYLFDVANNELPRGAPRRDKNRKRRFSNKTFNTINHSLHDLKKSRLSNGTYRLPCTHFVRGQANSLLHKIFSLTKDKFEPQAMCIEIKDVLSTKFLESNMTPRRKMSYLDDTIYFFKELKYFEDSSDGGSPWIHSRLPKTAILLTFVSYLKFLQDELGFTPDELFEEISKNTQ